MEWPQEIIDAFAKALELKPVEWMSEEQVLDYMLDETARRAVWRCRGDPSKIGPALRFPYTPLGSVTGSLIDGRVEQMVLKGEPWSKAVEAFHNYIEQNVHAIFDAFQDQAEPYDDLLDPV